VDFFRRQPGEEQKQPERASQDQAGIQARLGSDAGQGRGEAV
jgi:hypothetical protein